MKKLTMLTFLLSLALNTDIATADTKQKAAQKNWNLMVANLYKMRPENLHINANLMHLNH